MERQKAVYFTPCPGWTERRPLATGSAPGGRRRRGPAEHRSPPGPSRRSPAPTVLAQAAVSERHLSEVRGPGQQSAQRPARLQREALLRQVQAGPARRLPALPQPPQHGLLRRRAQLRVGPPELLHGRGAVPIAAERGAAAAEPPHSAPPRARPGGGGGRRHGGAGRRLQEGAVRCGAERPRPGRPRPAHRCFLRAGDGGAAAATALSRREDARYGAAGPALAGPPLHSSPPLTLCPRSKRRRAAADGGAVEGLRAR